MNCRSFFSGVLGGLLVFATLSVPGLRSQSPTTLATSGLITMVLSGSCPAYYTEVSALSGAVPYGTTAANMDVGTTGGSDTITPTVSSLTAAAQTFTGSSANTSAVTAGTPSGTNNAPTIAWPVGVPTFSGSALGTHTHTVTPTGTNGTSSVATVTGSKAGSSAGAFSTIGGVSPGSSFTVPAQTFTGASDTTSAVSAGTPAGTIAWPAGVPTQSAATFSGSQLATHLHTLTATGTNSTSSVTGTLSSFDNRSAFVKVIFCVKS